MILIINYKIQIYICIYFEKYFLFNIFLNYNKIFNINFQFLIKIFFFNLNFKIVNNKFEINNLKL